MVTVVARTGRHRQRYHDGSRLVAGCIPYRSKRTTDGYNGNSKETLEVLMVTPHRGQGLLFPKGGWENDETKEEAACREALEEAGVKGKIETVDSLIKLSSDHFNIILSLALSGDIQLWLIVAQIMDFFKDYKFCISNDQASEDKCYLGSWDFFSMRHQKDRNVAGCRKGYMFVLAVTEQLDSWPEKDARQRKWVSVREAREQCKLEWMRLALDKFVEYRSNVGVSNSSSESPDESFSDSFSQSDEENSQQCTENSENDEVYLDAVSDDDRLSSILAEIPLTEESASSSCDE